MLGGISKSSFMGRFDIAECARPVPDGQGCKAPYYISVEGQPVFALPVFGTGLARAMGRPLKAVYTSRPANDPMTHIHNTGNSPHRMPAILRREDIDVWLNGSAQ